MITIYTHTHNPFKKEFWKYAARKIAGKYSGPDAVLDSLKRGLLENGVRFEINPLFTRNDTVHVLSGVEILKEVLSKKSEGKIKTLMVGPTLVETPFDHNNIIQDTRIDYILFPSQWTKDFYTSLVPELGLKIQIWPAGVTVPQTISQKQKILVFKKHVPENVYNQVTELLKNKDLPYDIITYGTFTKSDYLKKLESASVLIYLQASESQGIALQEAWSYDVPTLVWKNTVWKTEKYSWTDEKISAPYMDDAAGKFFTLETFGKELEKVLDGTYVFTPKKYCLESLSDKASAQKYIEILHNYVK